MNTFLSQPTLTLAKSLIGMELIHQTAEGITSGIIVETEAYKGPEDRAAHSYGDRRTKRTEVMFGPPGHIYMYFIYGMHVCFNIVSGPPGKPEAVLIRAIEPLKGIDLMKERRYSSHKKLPHPNKILLNLTSGPGKLCKAMGLGLDLYGIKLNEGPVFLKEHKKIPASMIEAGPRINVSYAEEAAFYPWRFWLKGNPYVSRI
ncbi:DNA-3-methyladenine glycosylase [Fictibacillus aquaticus]|uniref:Putative 3-methyladenine DNA glycosylase n=1 Tax=Fictibacillus aquaticus TaxID=2021314 RepID=A0A235FAH0_9BACL|nr:DNA-3-methyladenine glycosylase [Fictibacillus aquaticus]OYD58296.1 3-methyladenine DNA glycosylase [Fictibacillus aquaticus]